MSDTCVLQNSGGPYGENIVMQERLNCSRAVQIWVEEEKDYNNEWSPRCSRFTQVVWKHSKYVGCAIKSCPKGNLVTCSYDPPGNVFGQFKVNV